MSGKYAFHSTQILDTAILLPYFSGVQLSFQPCTCHMPNMYIHYISVDELVADKQCIIYRVAMPHLHACILVWYTQVYTLASLQ